MFESDVCRIGMYGFGINRFADVGADLGKRQRLPSFRVIVHDSCVFVTRKAEMNEPLPVEQPCRSFQQLNPTSVVLDQIIVGGKDGYDSFLFINVLSDMDCKCVQIVSVDARNRCFVAVSFR